MTAGCALVYKFLVLSFNVVFFLIGCAIIGLGTYMYLKMEDYLSFLGGTGFITSSIVLIVIGVIVALVSFMGIFAACLKNRCMLYTFSVLMGFIVFAEFGVAIAILLFKVDAEEIITDAMNKVDVPFSN